MRVINSHIFPNIEHYQYLYSKQGLTQNAIDILECNYDMERLKKKFVVRNSATNLYYVFNDVNHFYQMMQILAPEDRCFHEVIFGWQLQKIKLDIDIDNTAIAQYISSILADSYICDMIATTTDNPQVIALIDAIIDTIKTTFIINYGIFLNNEDIIVTCSNGRVNANQNNNNNNSNNINQKYSYHIIINNYCVANYKEAGEFTSRLRTNLCDGAIPHIDFHVNKSTQNFRLAENCKENSSRYKRIISTATINDAILHPPTHTFADSVIQMCENCTLLPEIYTEKPKNVLPAVGDDDRALILNIIADYTHGHKLDVFSDNMITFKRIAPSNCLLCERVHDHDNTLYITVVQGAVYYNCRHNKGKSQLIGNYGGTAAIVAAKEHYLSRIIANVSDEEPRKTSFDRLPPENKHVYNERALRDFEHVDTLCVRARMKMGKTKKLVEYVDKWYGPEIYKLTAPKIIFISFRQTFSANIKEKFPTFTLYNEVKGLLNQRRLIVQVESLHRLEIDEPPDLVILDECESIFEQFDSGLLKHFNAAFAAFQWLLAVSHHCVVMDANMSDRTYNVLTRMRTTKRDSTLFYHTCEYNNACDDKYAITTDKSMWLSELYRHVDAGSHVGIPTSSLATAEIICETIKRKYPNIKIGIYTSKMCASDRKTHFSNVNEYWSQYDVLIYTPTVSAGVSFEKTHFDVIFGYFIDTSCNVETCIQMLGRIRNVSTHSYNLYFKAAYKNLPTQLEQIKRALYERRENLFKVVDPSMLQFEYTDIGAIKYHENDYFHLWLENTRVNNLSRNCFIKRFLTYLHEYGATLSLLTSEMTPETQKEVLSEHNNIKQIIIDNENAAIANAAEMTPEDVKNYQEKILLEADITQEQKAAYDKYRLRRYYSWDRDISGEFVAKYKESKIKQIYNNLKQVAASYNFETAIAQIQTQERENYKYAINNDIACNYDLSTRYMFDKHRIALGLLKLCTYTHLKDTRFISFIRLFTIFQENEKLLLSSIQEGYQIFGYKIPAISAIKFKKEGSQKNYVRDIIKLINKMLDTMYGTVIAKQAGDDGMYYLKRCELFTYSLDDITRPLIAVPAAVDIVDVVANVVGGAPPIYDNYDELAVDVIADTVANDDIDAYLNNL